MLTPKPTLLEYGENHTPPEELAGLSVMEYSSSQCLADNWERMWLLCCVLCSCDPHFMSKLSQANGLSWDYKTVETLGTCGEAPFYEGVIPRAQPWQVKHKLLCTSFKLAHFEGGCRLDSAVRLVLCTHAKRAVTKTAPDFYTAFSRLYSHLIRCISNSTNLAFS
jgi:hypothetical protein